MTADSISGMKAKGDLNMETSRIMLYAGIALAVVVVVYMILVAEPDPDNPTNMVHLLFGH